MSAREKAIERMALAMVHATAKHYGDPPPVNPDLTLTKILAGEALAALSEAPLEGWQPIASCPTNQSILIFIPNAEHYGPGIYRAILVEMGTGRRWHATTVHMGRDLNPDSYPTHWMPLPPPPAHGGGG